MMSNGDTTELQKGKEVGINICTGLFESFCCNYVNQSQCLHFWAAVSFQRLLFQKCFHPWVWTATTVKTRARFFSHYLAIQL